MPDITMYSTKSARLKAKRIRRTKRKGEALLRIEQRQAKERGTVYENAGRAVANATIEAIREACYGPRSVPWVY